MSKSWPIKICHGKWDSGYGKVMELWSVQPAGTQDRDKCAIQEVVFDVKIILFVSTFNKVYNIIFII